MERFLKNKKIRWRFRDEIEPQEIFLDRLARKKEEELGISEKKLETPLSRRILQVLLILFLAGGFVLAGKAFQWQILEGRILMAEAQANKFLIRSIQATRGVIYDRNFEQLVFNQPAFDLIVEKNSLPEVPSERERVLENVCDILRFTQAEEQARLDCAQLKKQIENSGLSQLVVAENLPHQALILFEAEISELPGFQVQQNAVREYKDSPVFSPLLGYTGKISKKELETLTGDYSITDLVGREGLEKSYEKVLARRPGKLRIEQDVLGKPLTKEIISLPEPGDSLVLWLDAKLQKKIFQELENGIKAVNSTKGAVVMMDPQTGGVLALVSYPSYDNNIFKQKTDPTALQNLFNDPQQPLFNRVIAGQYPPGSTIKPLMALAALEKKIISPQKQINCEGLIEVPHRYDPEVIYYFRDWAVHGATDMRRAIALSCNVYFYTIGGGYGELKGLGPSAIKEGLQLFGWGKETQIDLPGEKPGLLPDKAWKETVKKEGWWDGDTYHLSIGQGDILVTPLQVATAFSAIANGGKLYQPQVVQKIVDKQKNLVKQIEPGIIRKDFINPENVAVVKEGMRAAVVYGSAVKWLQGLPVEAAAKTGTAQSTKKGFYHNWATVFAPYENPEVVLTVVVEDVEGMQAAALPIARAVLEWYFTRK